jgi:hypothetical protein
VAALADDRHRQAVADAGQRYALSLKGEERLCESVVEVLQADWKVRNAPKS